MKLVGITKAVNGTALLVAGCLFGGGGLALAAEDVLNDDMPRSAQQFSKNSGFHFAIVADRTGGRRPGVFSQAIDHLNLLRPEFVIGVGDLLEGYSKDHSELVLEYEQLDETVARLKMPFFYVVGNHDVADTDMLDMWQQRRGRTYYDFVYKDVLFIVLNTEDPPIPLGPELLDHTARVKKIVEDDPSRAEELREEAMNDKELISKFKMLEKVHISDQQVDYVRRVLADHSEVRWTMLFMHKPAWHYDSPEFNEIERLLADRRHTAFAGHTHSFSYYQRNGNDYITLGTTGGVWHGGGPGLVDHVTWVTVTDEGPVVANIKVDGVFGKYGQEDNSQSAVPAPK